MCLTLWEYSGVLFSSGNIPAVFKTVYVPLVKLAIAILNSELFEEMYDSSEDEYDDVRLDSAIRYKCYELDIEPEPAIPPQKPPLHDRLKPKQSIKKESFMEKTVRKNQTVAKIAGEIEIGKTGLTVLKNAIRQAKILPPMIAGYLDTAIGDVVCANILLMIGDQVKNEKFQFVAENALQASWLNVMSSFNIQDIVDKIMNNASIQNIMNQMPEMPKPSSK